MGHSWVIATQGEPMNTTTAAAQANVTVATIRDWARRGIIAATKRAGRWIIDAASLAHRITIGTWRTAMTEPKPPIHLTSKTRRIRDHIGAVGDITVLRAAFKNGQPVTLDGKFAGEQVYLGHTRQTYDDGISLETIAFDYETGAVKGFPGITGAVYLIDLSRLDRAPRVAAIVAEANARTAKAAQEAEMRARAEDARLDALDHEDY
jgi:hypothetical protein